MSRSLLALVLVLSACDGPAPEPDAGRRDAPATDAPRADAAEDDDAPTPIDAGTDAPPADPTFSFIVIPDTQNETINDTNAMRHFDHRLDWIVEHEADLDIRFVLQTGDLCNWDTPDHDQYVRASEGFETLEAAGIPFMLTIGNHDTAATCEGGSACPGESAHVNLRRTGTFNSFFPTTRFPTLAGTFEENKVDNAYHLVSAGGVEWIIIAMELWPRREAFEWVGEVLAEHPDANGIVFTHAFLTGSSTIGTSNGGYGDTSPRVVFDEVLSQHANLRFVFSGHEGYSGHLEETGVEGNTIHLFLFNIDDSTNPTRIIEVDTEMGSVHGYVYAPATDEMVDGAGTDVMIDDFDFLR